jgi:hypothetical protein
MHSIVYMVILTRIVERFDCFKMTAVDFVASTAGQKAKSSSWKWSEFFFKHQAGPKRFLERRRFYQSQLAVTPALS